jgi:hypothetical protein
VSESGERPKIRLRSASTILPPVTVDCSHWPRAAGPRSRTNLKSASLHFPLPTDWVEVRVPDAAAPTLVAAAPALKLVHDPARSRADAGGVVVAFTPADSAATREQLAALIPAIRAALGPGVVADVRVCPTA